MGPTTTISRIWGITYFLVCLRYSGAQDQDDETYNGLHLGKFNSYAHQVSGEVYVVDPHTLLVKNFIYDGLGKDTYFWAGSTVRPSNVGFLIPDEDGKTNKLQRYLGKDITIRMPENKKLNSIKWVAVWDFREHTNFGDVYISEGFEPPTPQPLSELSRLGRGVRSGPVTIMDSKTLLIPDFFYDGNATDTYFWVGEGPQPSRHGTKVPDEKGYLNALGPYNGINVILELPGKLTVFEVDWISIWDAKQETNYGSVLIPDGLNIPPALVELVDFESSLPNCEQLHRTFQVSWEIFGPQVTFQLSGQIGDNDYMALGLSGSPNSSQMLEADVAISYVDGYFGITTDYNITGKYPCVNTLGLFKGVCPDQKVGGIDSFQYQTYVKKDGITTITYRRNLINTGDDGDQIYVKEGESFFVWAIGQYNKFREPGFHHLFPKGDTKWVLGRKPAQKNCHPFSKKLFGTSWSAWKPFVLAGKTVNTFAMHIGPSGGKKGYQAISGQPSPGIVWYANGAMTPTIRVQRGKKYTFRVEGGNNAHEAGFYHPFYITDDPHGGYSLLKTEEREKVKIYAGVKFDSKGRPQPTTVGRLCLWHYENGTDRRRDDDFESFSKFRDILKTKCDKGGQAAVLEWSPNITTPDLLYYQSYTMRNMGWQITVHDDLPSSSIQNSVSLNLLGVTLLLSSLWLKI